MEVHIETRESLTKVPFNFAFRTAAGRVSQGRRPPINENRSPIYRSMFHIYKNAIRFRWIDEGGAAVRFHYVSYLINMGGSAAFLGIAARVSLVGLVFAIHSVLFVPNGE